MVSRRERRHPANIDSPPPNRGRLQLTLLRNDNAMQRKPNYQFERRERERLKAAKNAEKAAAKKQAKAKTSVDVDDVEGDKPG